MWKEIRQFVSENKDKFILGGTALAVAASAAAVENGIRYETKNPNTGAGIILDIGHSDHKFYFFHLAVIGDCQPLQLTHKDGTPWNTTGNKLKMIDAVIGLTTPSRFEITRPEAWTSNCPT